MAEDLFRENTQDEVVYNILQKHHNEILNVNTTSQIVQELRSAMRHEKNSWAFKNE
jgi:hypothetical protein